jgi:hypothetical protein
VDGEGRLYQDFYKMVLENESRTDTPNATGACVRALQRGDMDWGHLPVIAIN